VCRTKKAALQSRTTEARGRSSAREEALQPGPRAAGGVRHQNSSGSRRLMRVGNAGAPLTRPVSFKSKSLVVGFAFHVQTKPPRRVIDFPQLRCILFIRAGGHLARGDIIPRSRFRSSHSKTSCREVDIL